MEKTNGAVGFIEGKIKHYLDSNEQKPVLIIAGRPILGKIDDKDWEKREFFEP